MNLKYLAFKQYLQAVERFLEHELAQTQAEIQAVLQAQGYTVKEILDDQDIDHKIDMMDHYLIWQKQHFEEIFPEMFRNSLFVSMYSYLENQLDSSCKFIQNWKNLGVSLNDFQGKGILRARSYLVKVAGMDFPNSVEWNEILNYNKLRNCIVHSDGYIEKSGSVEYIKNYISLNPYLDIRYDRIVLLKGFCENVFENIKLFQQEFEVKLHSIP